MEKCNKCKRCVGCDVWRFYTFGMIRISIVRSFLKLILWKEHELEELRQLWQNVTSWIALYPERRRIVFYVMRYKVILWLSVDEVGNHAV